METPSPTAVPPSQLGALREGGRMLLLHPFLSLGLVVLAVVLSQLGPALELAARTGGSLGTQMLFGFVGQLPLEIYALPRWLARLDAETASDPANPREGWQPLFETRWLRAFGVKLLLFLPCLPLFLVFGWAPMRVLLRGDRIPAALRWSGQAMAGFWPRVVQAVLAIVLALFLGLVLVSLVTALLFPQSAPSPDVDALTRLRHPAYWVAAALLGLLNLWANAAFLALYLRLERLVHPSEAK